MINRFQKQKPEFYLLEEIAEILRSSKRTIYNRIYRNRVYGEQNPVPPYIKMNGKLLFPSNDFERWIEQKKSDI
ncbi:helix-turn-helix domain-containing protein [Neptunicella sp.]|uniref:helix-turn-helix domain-containing protein n=1 Tax=Neptunicella sp. TaxID=2125986 RepID=UPI003F693C4D